MLQQFSAHNESERDGTPAVGFVVGRGLNISWHIGDERSAPNGAFVETVIAAAKQRLEYYQEAADGRFNCRENAAAITFLEEALRVLAERTSDRETRGVEGTHAI